MKASIPVVAKQAPAMDSIEFVHVKLLASDLLSLTIRPCNPPSFTRKHKPISRAETVGVVAGRERRDKFLRFLVDDGTGCVPCILWLNHDSAVIQEPDSDLRSEMACSYAEMIRLGGLVRVRGRITLFRGEIQITVRDVLVERDPNAELLHWLECMRLARRCYDPPSPPSGS